MKILSFRNAAGGVRTGVLADAGVLDVSDWIERQPLPAAAARRHAASGSFPPAAGILRWLECGPEGREALAAHVRAHAATGATLPPATVRSAASRVVGHVGTGTTDTAAMRRMRRTPVAWQNISPDRLRAAWQAILVEHGHPGADLELVGVYGPLPVDSVVSVALAADRRAVIDLAGDARGVGAGDLALARHKPTGRLLRSAGATVQR